jgi:hypothetical protein
MGKLSSGIFGGVSGKVGNLTGSSWKGIQVVKSRPQSVAYPGTAGQVAQTTKMSAIVAFCKMILSSWIKPLWDRSAVKMSGYNAFVRANIAEFADGEINDYSGLVMSQGTMEATPFNVATVEDGAVNIVVTWTPSLPSGLQNTSDISFLAVINEATGEVAVNSGATRITGTSSVSLAGGCSTGDVLHFYLAFKRSNGTVISSSSYTTTTVVS